MDQVLLKKPWQTWRYSGNIIWALNPQRFKCMSCNDLGISHVRSRNPFWRYRFSTYNEDPKVLPLCPPLEKCPQQDRACHGWALWFKNTQHPHRIKGLLEEAHVQHCGSAGCEIKETEERSSKWGDRALGAWLIWTGLTKARKMWQSHCIGVSCECARQHREGWRLASDRENTKGNGQLDAIY